jgi:uncharacterized membrane protein
VQLLLAQPVAPGWLVFPVATVAMLAVAGHWLALARSSMPESRKRIRSACGVVMLLAIPILAYAFGVADAADHRRFVLAWMLACGLLLIVVLLAIADVVNNVRIARRERAMLRDEMRAAREQLAQADKTPRA